MSAAIASANAPIESQQRKGISVVYRCEPTLNPLERDGARGAQSKERTEISSNKSSLNLRTPFSELARASSSVVRLIRMSEGISSPEIEVYGGQRKMRDMNLRHQFARVEIAGHDNAGPICRGGKCGKS